MKLVCIDWSVVIATGMRPRMVVVVNGLFDSLLCLLKGVEGLIKPHSCLRIPLTRSASAFS